MNACAPPEAAAGGLVRPRYTLRGWLAESLAREATLTRFGLLMWALMIPAVIAYGLDDRLLRGVPVWTKPLKFMASTGLFALCTAWFVGLLPQARRGHPAVRLVVWGVIVSSAFEVGYITLQAALGDASHFNVGSPLHATMYRLMAVFALLLTATQPLLAWQIVRHGDPTQPVLWRRAVITGLVLTFVLGAASGMPLGGLQPPAGAGLPVVGWHAAGDLRPAHFLGIHAQQLLPLAGLLLARWSSPAAAVALGATVAAYVAAWVALMTLGLAAAAPA
jgi:hypothetical protein